MLLEELVNSYLSDICFYIENNTDVFKYLHFDKGYYISEVIDGRFKGDIVKLPGKINVILKELNG
jgi:hypothetical protein